MSLGDAVERDFAGALARLIAPDGPHAPGQLMHLSHATGDELQLWRREWPLVEDARRVVVADVMLRAAEADIQIDFDPLFLDMLDDSLPAIRATAIDGLWESHAPSLMDRFTHLLKADLSAEVRARSAAALGRFIQREELGETAEGSTSHVLLALIDAAERESEDVAVRRRATESAGYADQSMVHGLIERMAGEPELELRIGAARAMGHSADERWGRQVDDWLDTEEPALRFEAARAAGELLLAGSLARLALLAAEDEVEIRQQAIWALGEIGGDRAREVLEQLAEEVAEDGEWEDALSELIEDAISNAALGDGELDLFSFDPFQPDEARRADGSDFAADDERDA